MYYVTFNVFCILTINCIHKTSAQNGASAIDSLDINEIADALIQSLGVSNNESGNTRIEELKEKINKIKSYAIDKHKYSRLLTNITMETNLNETNFFKALSDEDHFKFLLNKEPKSLYLQLKEKMNRDDIMKVLAEKGESKKIVRSARKAMGEDYFGSLRDEEVLDVVVDKILGEKAHDEHDYDAKKNASIYWDPQGELEDLNEYHKHDGRRIFRGERTTVRYYPFMVSVHVMGRFWCGGAVYWHDLVLTSAACLQLMHNNRFFRENPRVLQVRVGSNHSRIGGDVIDALEVYFHPGYNPRNLRNNIAVIRLRRHLHFNYHRIPKIIDISHSSNTVPATAEVMLLGWGVTKMSQKLSYEPVYLQRKFLPVYPNTFCKEVYGDQFITQTMFCAGTFTTGEGACDHDAGGPAILAGRLVGIISFGPTVCGYPNAPTVFTLVGAFADWIETVNETMPEYYRANKRTSTTTRRPMFDYLNTLFAQEHKKKEVEEEIKPVVMIATTTEATTTTTEAEETTTEGETTTEPAALRLLREQLSDEDSWGAE